MEFADFETSLETSSGLVRLRITADALHFLWGEGVGPQTAEGLFEQHRAMFEEIADDKLLAGDLDHGVVVVDALYLED